MKILVGSPVSMHHAYCTPQYLDMLRQISCTGCDILFVDNSDTDKFYNDLKNKIPIVRYGYDLPTIKERMVASRNYLREYAIKNEYDYFMNIDQDVIPPENFLERLISHKKDFVT